MTETDRNHTPAGAPDARRVRNIIMLLAASVGLMMTGHGIVLPVFAKRLGELGAGVETLGFMTMAFAAAQFLLAPFMGALADRFGRRPLILLALAGVFAANLAFLFADSPAALIAVRFLQGGITAGLLPATMGIIADLVPEDHRAQWVGMVMGGYGAGFIFGPALGGVLYDHWGFAAPFAVSAGLALLGLLAAFFKVPETHQAVAHQEPRQAGEQQGRGGVLAALPRPIYLLATLLFLDFLAVFAFAFVEPQMAFYLYDRFSFTTTQFGILVGAYGLAMVFGQAVLGRLSDRVGRKPVIAAGMLLTMLFYLGLATQDQFALMFATALLAGLGVALATPALSAFYLDITAAAHRSRVMGLKESAAALGGVAGPLAVALFSRWLPPQTIFIIAAVLMVAGAVLVVTVLKEQRRRTAAQAAAPPVSAGTMTQPNA